MDGKTDGTDGLGSGEPRERIQNTAAEKIRALLEGSLVHTVNEKERGVREGRWQCRRTPLL